ncbi:hypothetical protein B1813_21090 [Saccharomonospora piscinae]|uniref:dTMP kinase n=1 Tax=Saccharomonospora piscinae TaxID=687388 RepID=A0A1V8ZWZ9_SACPI|nr:hypothetical protein [Saccharomonospora piscinae]OQO89439.1 hypothetical protein B1813_21090 [Saccharomonospora piscinae]TLW91129.1 hypothetical protein FFT09_17830 [Saccharomonospora piscinae]
MTDSRPLCPKVILEGTRLTKKTELAFTLRDHARFAGARRYRYHLPLVSAEWSGLTNEAWGPSLITFEPEQQDAALEAYRTWVRLFELHRYYTWIVDRFHLSTLVHQARTGRHLDFGPLEERLAALGFAVVLCTRQPETFEEAREERLRVSANPRQYDDLGVFVREQDALRTAAARGRLPVLELDVTEYTEAQLADTVVDWLADRNLLHRDR